MNGQPARRVADLIVWRLAHELTLGVYQTTGTFPKWELYALGDQMRRAAVSIPANIAEGFRKRTQREKLRYLNIA
jgi:four helix bundle protein